jgi:hypothetical protein
MRKSLLCMSLFCLVTAVGAAPQTPGTLHIIDGKAGNKEIAAKANDVVEIQIANPALPVMVSNVDISVAGAAKFGGLVDSSPPGVAGGGRLSAYIHLTDTARSGTVEYSYKNATGVVKGKLTIQVTK